jgi:isoleucyl-tRNA synthetase
MVSLDLLLEKYEDILKEEVNVKELGLFVSDGPIVKVFKPLGSQLSAKFGKDTGQIIANGKQGNVRENADGVEVFNLQGQTWQLTEGDYEVVYEGLDGDDIAIDGNTIVKLDLRLTPELEKEGVAREISRFLNQMRKDADFPVDARVRLLYQTSDDYLLALFSEFAEFFKEEALLLSLEAGVPQGDIISDFTSDGKTITLSLSK